MDLRCSFRFFVEDVVVVVKVRVGLVLKVRS